MRSRDCFILRICSTSGLCHCMVGLIAAIAGHLDGIRVDTVETKHGLTIKVVTPHIHVCRFFWI